MKIKINKKQVNEIQDTSPQYKYTAGKSGKEKAILNNFFDGKERIVERFPLEVPISYDGDDTDVSSKDLATFLKFCTGMRHEYFEFLIDLGKPAQNDNVAARKQKAKESAALMYLLESMGGIDELANLPPIRRRNRIAKLKEDMNLMLSDYYKTFLYFGYKLNLKEYKVSMPSKTDPKKIKMLDLRKYAEDIGVARGKLVEIITKGSIPSFSSIEDMAEQYIKQNLTELNSMNQFRRVYQFFLETIERPEFVMFCLMLHLPPNRLQYNGPGSILFDYTRKMNALNKPNANFENVTMESMISDLHVRVYAEPASKDWSDCTSVISRVPVDIVRMGDFSQLASCHSVGGKYASCATQEAVSNMGGAIAYLFTAPYTKITPELMNELENTSEEFLSDPERSIKGKQAGVPFNPLCRVRFRSYTITLRGGRIEKTYNVIIPSGGKMYGASIEEYLNKLFSMAIEKQSSTLKEMEEYLSNKDNYIASVELMGGSYTDEAYFNTLLAEFFSKANMPNCEKAATADRFEEKKEFDPDIKSKGINPDFNLFDQERIVTDKAKAEFEQIKQSFNKEQNTKKLRNLPFELELGDIDSIGPIPSATSDYDYQSGEPYRANTVIEMKYSLIVKVKLEDAINFVAAGNETEEEKSQFLQYLLSNETAISRLSIVDDHMEMETVDNVVRTNNWYPQVDVKALKVFDKINYRINIVNSLWNKFSVASKEQILPEQKFKKNMKILLGI